MKGFFKYIVIFNVDFYDLRLIDLIDIDMYGKDLIIGSKRAYWSQDNRSLFRRMISMAFNLYLKLMFGFRGSDTHGVKLIKEEVVDSVLPLSNTKSGIFDTELVIRAQWAGYAIADFPVVVEEKRPPRFSNRFIRTPLDIYEITISLLKK